MTRTKTQPSSPVSRLELSRSSFPRLIGASVVSLPLLWGASGCSSSDEDPNTSTEGDTNTTSGGTSSDGVTSGAPSTTGTAGGGTTTSGGANGMTGGGATGGSSTDDSDTGGATGGSATDDSDTGGATGGGATDDSDTDDSDTSGSDSGGGDTDDSATGGGDTDGSDGGGVPASGADGGGGGSADGGTSDVDAGMGSGSGEPLSPGCGTAFQNPPPDGQQQTVEINGTSRYYLMDVPDNADNETPLMLIFALHGFDMNNIAVVDLFNFTERSAGQAITVWPQGEGPHPGNVSHWGDQVLQSTWSPNEQNYAFLRQVMTDLGERYCIDQERIFITGFSMGGFFTNQMACDHSDWFRGFAPVAGGGPQTCANADAQSAIMVQHGTADDIVELASGEGSRDFWQEQNGCGTSSSNSLANCQFYDGCAEGKPVAWCTGNYDHYIPDEVASNIWSFFSSL